MRIFKAFINEILDVKKLIGVLWLSLWYVLALCLICKYCFHMWFPIVSENVYFNHLCDFIDQHILIKHFFALNFYVLNISLIYLISTKQYKFKNKKELFSVLAIAIGNYFLKTYNNMLGTLVEMMILVVLPIIVSVVRMKEKTLWKVALFGVIYPIIVNVIVVLWQLSIFLIRDIELVMAELPTTIILILQIDYYIFLIITYIGGYIMGNWGAWLWCNELTKLEAYLEEEKKKEKPNQMIIQLIEKRIEKIKTKQNNA